MTQNENQKENEFKFKILRQLKDPCSALNAFLSKPLSPEETGHYGDSILRCSHLLRVPEFNMELEFTWDESISHEDSNALMFKPQNGGHHVSFSEMSEDCLGLDISETKYIQTLPFLEEAIVPSKTNPNVIILGLTQSRITHEDYEFKRMYKKSILKPINFCLKTFKFLGDIEQKIDEWNEMLEDSYEDNETTYIEYFVKDDAYRALENHFDKCKISSKNKDMLLSAISQNWHRSSTATRLGHIASILTRIDYE